MTEKPLKMSFFAALIQISGAFADMCCPISFNVSSVLSCFLGMGGFAFIHEP